MNHGSHWTYSMKGCRCDDCRRAHAEAIARSRAKRREGLELRQNDVPNVPPMPWLEFALCRGADPAIFFNRDHSEHTVAIVHREWCMKCPVMAQCREHGIAHEDHGVWGGTSASERRRIRKRRRLSAS